MPIYEFKCDRCGDEFEVIATIGQKTATCLICNYSTEHRLVSSLGKIKQFEGYFETDIDNKPVYIKHKQDLRDAVAKHNDGEEADKMGKLAIYDGIRTDRVKRREG